MQIAILFALIVLNGVFAMSEIALVTARKSRLQRLIDEGDPAAIAAAKLGADPTRFLSTIQIGITSIGVLNGIVGESTLAQPLAGALQGIGVPAAYAGYAGTGIVVALITYFTIVLGELVPKRLAQANPEGVARFVARPIGALARLSTPFVWLLSASTNLVLRLLGAAQRGAPTVTEEEIHALLAEGSHTGVIEKHEHAMVRNVFRLDDRQITSLMVPRGDIAVLDLELPFEDNLRLIEETDHNYYPVTREGIDDIVGIVSARRLLAGWVRSGARDIGAHVVAPLFVPETVTGMELLEHFRGSGRRAAFVVDEYGEVLGLVTLYDVIEAITGEFKPRNQDTASATQREDGSWLLDGLIALPDLKDRLELRELPDEDRARYHTLGGMLLLLLGRLPNPGDKVRWLDWEFEVLDLDGRKIDKVLAARRPAPVDTHGEAAP
jgi:putative hemolysin